MRASVSETDRVVRRKGKREREKERERISYTSEATTVSTLFLFI